MKLIHSKAELLQQPKSLEGVYKMIELAGRTCYHSQDKITEDSAKGFVERMIESNHTAMLEHGTIYLMFPVQYKPINPYGTETEEWFTVKYFNNPYSKITYKTFSKEYPNYIPEGLVAECDDGIETTVAFVTTNYRVLIENNWLDDLQYLCEPTEYHEKRYTVRLTTDRGVSHKLVRHRTFSFAQESQRYCGYDKDKFSGEIIFIIPSWIDKLTTKGKEHSDSGYSDMFTLEDWITTVQNAENAYMAARIAGLLPQEARSILPNATKTEIVMTGFVSDWRHFLDLRLFEKTGKVHPDMKELTNKLKDELTNADIWEDIIKYPSKFE